MASDSLTAARLREVLHYDPETGVFTRVAARASTYVGKPAGCVNKALGYIVVSVDGRPYYGHRLAILWMTGEWPKGQGDHINGDRTDNRWCNLRDVPKTTNVQNVHKARRHNASGLLGVRKVRTGGDRWDGMITHNKRLIYLGSFPTPEAAHEAYLEAKRRLHAGCTI